MNFQEIFSMMAAIVEMPNFPYLLAYKSDFYKLDREALQRDWTPISRFLWVVRPHGSDLCQLGVHRKMNEHVMAAIECGLRDSAAACAIYLLSSKGVRLLTRTEALAEVNKMEYDVRPGEVFDAGGKLLASFVVEPYDAGGRTRAVVRFGSAHGVSIPAWRHSALCAIALSEVIVHSSSLFTVLDKAYLDEVCISDFEPSEEEVSCA